MTASRPESLMLQEARMSAPWGMAKNVTKSNGDLPRVCGAIFFNDFGRFSESAKNDRFLRIGSGSRFMSGVRTDKVNCRGIYP